MYIARMMRKELVAASAEPLLPDVPAREGKYV
jgi:hypothetical protein